MESLWIILFLLAPDNCPIFTGGLCSSSGFFAGTQGFLIQNAKAKRCLQASTTDEHVILEDCNPTSDVQQWSWQDNFLINQGIRKCLSTGEANRVQTSPCGSAAHANWECANFTLHLVGSTHPYLTADKNKASLTQTESPDSQWRVRSGQSICDERPAKAEESRYVAMALTSTYADDQGADNMSVELQEALWFFRREDSSTWNYSILALSFVVLFLGLLLLGINIVGNRHRKIILMHKQAAEAAKPAELETKPPFVQLKEDSHLNPETQDLLAKEQRPGEVLVQWKDGNVTALYADKREEDV